MRKLDRTKVQIPKCLSKCLHNIHEWGDRPTRTCRGILWTQLNKFQNRLCVYCETEISRGRTTGHIEHFFDKGDPQYKHYTFDWNNLFGCCTSNRHCGHFKNASLPGNSRRLPNYRLLIKPDVDDPEVSLQFVSTGKVRVRRSNLIKFYLKGKHTIKALNLNESSLKNDREAQISRYKAQLLALNKLIGTISDVQFHHQYELIKQSSEKESFRTAVKQALF
jgi:uncharacterized protein (TIGR02646 family)